MEGGLVIILVIGLAYLFGWKSGKEQKVENNYNRDLRVKLENREKEIKKYEFDTNQKIRETHEFSLKVINEKQNLLNQMKVEFEKSFINGRKWLSDFILEAERIEDKKLENYLTNKKNPALKAAETITVANKAKREAKLKLKLLEYELKSLKEYFPFIEEYYEIIMNERINFIERNSSEIFDLDPVLKFIPKEEYKSLTSTERNQKALDRYLRREKNNVEIGRFYERYLGYLYEKNGWKFEYIGIEKGLEDLGRDLICEKNDFIEIVQAKCWSKEKLIREKYIFQLFGTLKLYELKLKKEKSTKRVSAKLITTTKLSDVAYEIGEHLKIKIKQDFKLNDKYPMIKCNINHRSKEKIYHLPFDQQYDRAKIDMGKGEFYAASIDEAEEAGFRRAKRFKLSES